MMISSIVLFLSRGNCEVGPGVAFAVLAAGLFASAAVVVVLAAPAPVVAGVAVVPKEVVVAAGAAADVEAGVEPPNRGAAVEVDAGAPVVLGAKRDGAGVEEEEAAAVVVVVVAAAPPNRDFGAGAEAGVDVDVVEGAAEAVGNRDAGFEAGAAVLAGVEPPSPPNRFPLAGAVVAGVLAAGAVVVAAGFAPKSEGVLVVVAGVDSAGLEVAAPPLNRLLDGAAVVLAENRPPAGFVADAALLNRLGVEPLAADVVGGVVVEPPKRPPGF